MKAKLVEKSISAVELQQSEDLSNINIQNSSKRLNKTLNYEDVRHSYELCDREEMTFQGRVETTNRKSTTNKAITIQDNKTLHNGEQLFKHTTSKA